jgi:hypothetical protein
MERTGRRGTFSATVGSIQKTRMTIKLLHLVACLLTVLASGDDFCFPRVTLVAAPMDCLPLDDPNTDFVNPEQAGIACLGERSVDGGMTTPSASRSPNSFGLVDRSTTEDIHPSSIFFFLLTPLLC